MPSRTFNANKSSLFADGPSNLGGGQDDHLPVGPWSGYNFVSAVRFATDWSTMKRITKATMRLTTSSQYHVGFSSDPDIYVRRITADWTANSAQADGGSWSTSPTVYPGPSATTTGQVLKDISTSEGAAVDIDITAIVRAWAPTSVEGGGAASNYGVQLIREGSSDCTEFYSYHASSGKPYITVTYEVDAAPVAATPTAPTGTTTSKRPVISGTGSDPDGDAITAYNLEVRQGTTVVYSVTTGSGTSYSHTPTSDLPSGALTARARAVAAGVTGAWSADRSFTIDRIPVMGAWSAPAATVTGTRRPVHTVAWSDPDGDAGEVFDLEVYSAPGGTPSGTAVYTKTSQTTGLGASSISHTPTSDLPGGELAARVRVKTKGVWSSWSSYRTYNVVLTVPTLTWLYPPWDGAFTHHHASDVVMSSKTLPQMRPMGSQVTYAAPSGTTISAVRIKVECVDPGIGGPAVGYVLTDVGLSVTGSYTWYFTPTNYSANWISGTVKITWTITAANGGVTTESRHTRFASGEWYGAVALGDLVTALDVALTPKLPGDPNGDQVVVFYRANSSPTAAAPGALWYPHTQAGWQAAVLGAMPATNAYLGVWVRIFRRLDDANMIVNGSFEDSSMAGWSSVAADSVSTAWGTAPDGSRILRFWGDGVANYPSVTQEWDSSVIVPGQSYRLSVYQAKEAGTATAQTTRFDSVAANGAATIRTSLANSLTTWNYKEGWYTFPTDGSAVKLRALCFINAAPPSATDKWLFDDVQVHGLTLGDAGLDILDISWTSLG